MRLRSFVDCLIPILLSVLLVSAVSAPPPAKPKISSKAHEVIDQDPVKPNAKIKTIGIVVFDGVERLDFEGPLAVLGWTSRVVECSFEFHLLSKNGKPVCDHIVGKLIHVDEATTKFKGFDLLIVPGGDPEKLKDPDLVKEIRRLASGSSIVASVGSVPHCSNWDCGRQNADYTSPFQEGSSSELSQNQSGGKGAMGSGRDAVVFGRHFCRNRYVAALGHLHIRRKKCEESPVIP